MHHIILSLFFVLSQSISGGNNIKPEFAKPNFSPYCTREDICKQECQCSIAANCKIIPMTKQMQQKVLNFLNQKRNMQSEEKPTASGMPMLIYDDKLEELSKCWLANCENLHSECFRTEKFPETSQAVGQIILDQVEEYSSEHWNKIVNNWHQEMNDSRTETIGNNSKAERAQKVYNYPQMLSDQVIQVGCSWSVLSKTLTFVCTFGPRGPRPGERIYKTGKICSDCPGGYKCTNDKPFENLCKKVKIERNSVKLTTPIIEGRKTGRNADDSIFRETSHDPDEEENTDWDIFWWLGTAIVVLLLVVVIVLSLFYIFGMKDKSCC